MDLDEARDFVRHNHRAVLTTRTAAGIQQSPVLVGLDDAGRLTVSTRETATKVRNLRADPWVQLVVLNDGLPLSLAVAVAVCVPLARPVTLKL